MKKPRKLPRWVTVVFWCSAVLFVVGIGFFGPEDLETASDLLKLMLVGTALAVPLIASMLIVHVVYGQRAVMELIGADAWLKDSSDPKDIANLVP